jgi:hypothetical protein
LDNIKTSKECTGQHRFYVAESGTVTNSEGLAICSVVVCTACGESKLIQHKVAAEGDYTVTTKNKDK